MTLSKEGLYMKFSVKGLYMTLSINDTQHKRHSTQQSSTIRLYVIMLSAVFYYLLWLMSLYGVPL
jgi:hypothetical protein